MGPKRAAYAIAEVPHYWVVDVNRKETVVMSDPADGDYRVRQVVPFDALLAVPGTKRKIRID
jgi:Uma2 family endonuclease